MTATILAGVVGVLFGIFLGVWWASHEAHEVWMEAQRWHALWLMERQYRRDVVHSAYLKNWQPETLRDVFPLIHEN